MSFRTLLSKVVKWDLLQRVIIGLTGGIGCGKSTCAQIIAQHGFHYISCDALAHRLLNTDRNVQAAIRQTIGPSVFNPDGTVNRRELGCRVFANAALFDWLESLIHPRVHALWQAEAKQYSRVVVEIPLLFEKKYEECFQLTVCVCASQAVQYERLQHKGMDLSQIDVIMKRQLPLQDKANKADVVIMNDASLAHLESQVCLLIKRLGNSPTL